MTALEYLEQGRTFSFEVNSKKRELIGLKMNARSLHSPSMGDRVIGSLSNTTNLQSDKAMDYEMVVKKEIAKLIDLQAELHARINKLENSKHRTILTEFYINCLTLEEVAEEMNYSVSQIKRNKNKAVKEFAELYGFVKNEPK